MKAARLILAAALLAAACQSDQDKLTDELRQARSTVAAEIMTVQTWAAGRIPDRFAENAFQKTSDTAKKEAETLEKATGRTRDLAGAYRSMSETAQQLAALAKNHQAADSPKMLASLRKLDESLSAQLKKSGS